MSHQQLRQEKNCLNCGENVPERYCPRCGQENVEINHSAIHLIIHYFQDLVHYDGRFWHTVRNLITKPGLVAKDFVEGKRKQNLEPIQFYVFASTVFFLIIFYMARSMDLDFKIGSLPQFNYQKRLHNLNQEKEHIGDHPDTSYVNLLIESIYAARTRGDSMRGDTAGPETEIDMFDSEGLRETYGNWLGSKLEKANAKRKKELETKYEHDETKATLSFFSEVFHRMPQLLFLSMPFLALFLRLLYIKSKRRYVDHFIFSIYHYSYSFVLLSFLFLITVALNSTPALSSVPFFLWPGFFIYIFFYLLYSMRRFYGDRWRFLIPRYLMLLIMLAGILIALLILFLLVTYLM